MTGIVQVSWPDLLLSPHGSFYSSLPRAELVFLSVPKCTLENKDKEHTSKELDSSTQPKQLRILRETELINIQDRQAIFSDTIITSTHSVRYPQKKDGKAIIDSSFCLGGKGIKTEVM